MAWKNGLGFLVAVSLLAVILCLWPFSPERVALYQLKGKWIQDLTFKTQALKTCSSVYSPTEDLTAKALADAWSGTAEVSEDACPINVAFSHIDRFELIDRFYYHVSVGGHDRSYTVEFPRPLALLPLGMALLALLFEMPAWLLGFFFALHPFFLAGFNLVSAIDDVVRSLILIFQTDRMLIGSLLCAAWILCYRHRYDEGRQLKLAGDRKTEYQNWSLYTALGLWNPLVHTLLGRIVFPYRATLFRIQAFLVSQLMVLALSLYLLTLSAKTSLADWGNAFFLPRYFTFAAVLFYWLQKQGSTRVTRAVLWRLEDLRVPLSSIALVESVALVFPPVAAIPTLTRVGLALMSTEIFRYRKSVWVPLKEERAVFFAIIGSSLFATWSVQSGLGDLIQVIANPKTHPSLLVLGCFLSAALLGFITGSISASFFTLYAFLMQTHNLPLVRASLVDGVLLGVLVCPYSFFNLVTAKLFRVRLADLWDQRLRGLAAPALISTLIFSLSSLSSISILRPATFVFICLAVVYRKLNRWGWRLDPRQSV